MRGYVIEYLDACHDICGRVHGVHNLSQELFIGTTLTQIVIDTVDIGRACNSDMSSIEGCVLRADLGNRMYSDVSRQALSIGATPIEHDVDFDNTV